MSDDPNMPDMARVELDRVILALASIVEGDRALGMEAAAMTLGVPQRTFEKLATRPGFPKPAKMGRRLQAQQAPAGLG